MVCETNCHIDTAKKDGSPFLGGVCGAVLLTIRALYMEEAADIIYFEEATGMQAEKAYECLQETQFSTRFNIYLYSTLLPRATLASLSHGSSYLLVDYYLVELVLYVNIPPIYPTKPSSL